MAKYNFVSRGSTAKSKKPATKAAIKKEEYPKKPLNAFMVWSKERRRTISKANPELHNSKISKMLGAEWKEMSEKEKAPFKEESRKLHEEARE